MTPRKKLIIAGAGFMAIVILLSAITLAVTFLSKGSETPDSQQSSEDASGQAANDKLATDGEGEPLPTDEEGSMLIAATDAARAYVTQLQDEPASGRQARLSVFFAPDSPVIEAAPPVRSVNYSTANVTDVQSTWYDLGKNDAFGVLVYLQVTPSGHSTENYEGWVVELRQYDNEWLPYAITKSDLPYIEGGDDE